MLFFGEHHFAEETLEARSSSTLIVKVLKKFRIDLLHGCFYHKQSASCAEYSYLAIAKILVLFCVIELASYFAVLALRLDF